VSASCALCEVHASPAREERASRGHPFGLAAGLRDPAADPGALAVRAEAPGLAGDRTVEPAPSLPQLESTIAASSADNEQRDDPLHQPLEPDRRREHARAEGAHRNRTGVNGFAGRCVTTPPGRRASLTERSLPVRRLGWLTLGVVCANGAQTLPFAGGELCPVERTMELVQVSAEELSPSLDCRAAQRSSSSSRGARSTAGDGHLLDVRQALKGRLGRGDAEPVGQCVGQAVGVALAHPGDVAVGADQDGGRGGDVADHGEGPGILGRRVHRLHAV
jgi:hypothetical protein